VRAGVAGGVACGKGASDAEATRRLSRLTVPVVG
jgi:hypothetical protein